MMRAAMMWLPHLFPTDEGSLDGTKEDYSISLTSILLSQYFPTNTHDSPNLRLLPFCLLEQETTVSERDVRLVEFVFSEATGDPTSLPYVVAHTRRILLTVCATKTRHRVEHHYGSQGTIRQRQIFLRKTPRPVLHACKQAYPAVDLMPVCCAVLDIVSRAWTKGNAEDRPALSKYLLCGSIRQLAARSRISSENFIFASCVWYFDPAYYGY